MRIQVFFAALLATEAAFGACFNFESKVISPLKPPIEWDKKTDAADKGLREDELNWASLRGEVKKPIGEVLKLLLDHDTTKSPKVDEIEVEKVARADYLDFHRVKFLIKPFPLVKIRWTEDWAYALAAGSPAKPMLVVISYQKTEGTSHIEHLCGSAVLRKLGNGSTDVFQYEEARATQRTPEETLEGLAGTLKSLRK